MAIQEDILALATFAGGCFWCTQHEFDAIDGVMKTVVGYTGGKNPYPTYEEVCSKKSGHVEAIQICYDEKIVSYRELLQVFWHSSDPTRDDGQFADTGPQYRPIIFYHTEEQHQIAEAYKNELILIRKNIPIKVAIEQVMPFYMAEDYHQKFYQKCPVRYNMYSTYSGRKERLHELWQNDL